MSGIVTATWHDLPSEMQLVVIDFLAGEDVVSLSKIDQGTYRVCVPARFKVCVYVYVSHFSTQVDEHVFYSERQTAQL